MPAAAGRGHLRASYADREQVIGTLKAAFVQGMLAKDEFDARMGQAFGSRTYAELAALTADLPAMPPPAQPPKPTRPQGGQPVLRPGRWIAVATVLYAGAWAYALFLSRQGGDDQSAGLLIVCGFLVYLGVLIASVGAIIVNRQDKRSGRRSPRRPAPGASRQASRRLPSADPGGQLPPGGHGHRHTAEAVRRRLPRLPLPGRRCAADALVAGRRAGNSFASRWPRAEAGGWPPWPDFGLTVTPNADNCCALLSNVLAGQHPDMLVTEASVYIYGSEGWGFESLRARLRARQRSYRSGSCRGEWARP
jgi:hypothetical protein